MKLHRQIPVEVNTEGVRRLKEVNYASWRLRIIVYISPLHEIDER